MKLREFLHTDCGLRFIIDGLEIQSGVAKRLFLDSPFETDTAIICAQYAALQQAVAAVRGVDHQAVTTLQFRLASLKDLHTTLANLSGGMTLDDIELFEVKHLAMLTAEVRKAMDNARMECNLPDAEEAVRILDPDGMRMASFFVYDSYSPRLRELRKKQAAEPDDEALFNQMQDEELRIREQLSAALRPLASTLQDCLQQIAQTDILLAKALQMLRWDLCFPTITTDGTTRFTDMWNPEVEAILSKQNKTYQRNSITLSPQPTILTGSNMGGKTVVLKTVALCQLLAQFGLGIPATEAVITPRIQVLMSMSDNQSIASGLSSFAAEMMQINAILCAARTEKNLLILIDEPARTTNPIEGTALVSGLIEVLRATCTTCLMVTHYTINAHDCPCLRVQGMENGQMNYKLLPAIPGDVPHEALNIAEQLGIDAEWLDAAKHHLNG